VEDSAGTSGGIRGGKIGDADDKSGSAQTSQTKRLYGLLRISKKPHRDTLADCRMQLEKDRLWTEYTNRRRQTSRTRSIAVNAMRRHVV
jgi:hypothetical protein